MTKRAIKNTKTSCYFAAIISAMTFDRLSYSWWYFFIGTIFLVSFAILMIFFITQDFHLELDSEMKCRTWNFYARGNKDGYCFVELVRNGDDGEPIENYLVRHNLSQEEAEDLAKTCNKVFEEE